MALPCSYSIRVTCPAREISGAPNDAVFPGMMQPLTVAALDFQQAALRVTDETGGALTGPDLGCSSGGIIGDAHFAARIILRDLQAAAAVIAESDPAILPSWLADQ